jgi:glycosyltransferase involved in cell wall biosynthesis
MISFIIPSHNNLRHLKNVYTSIQKHAPYVEVILLDDGSTDGTWEWIQQQNCIKYKSNERVGHTILYDKGIELATNEIVGILHADMILGSNYVENILKHLSPGKVVCGTRIEPPLHPSAKEKIIMNFGLDFDDLNIPAFEAFCLEKQIEFKDKTTRGIFAPWCLYKKDFQAIGGHDPLFAPFPCEDSDIFNRWILNGYEMVQSRDAFVYHLTCRGHRWTEGIQNDTPEFLYYQNRAIRNFIRKWGGGIRNDEYHHPIISHKYDVGFIVKNCSPQLLEFLEPWCSTIYVDCDYKSYIEKEQSNTKYDLWDRIKPYDNEKQNHILIDFDARYFTQSSFNILQQLSDIIAESGEIGEFELDCFKITISNLTSFEENLIKI